MVQLASNLTPYVLLTCVFTVAIITVDKIGVDEMVVDELGVDEMETHHGIPLVYYCGGDLITHDYITKYALVVRSHTGALGKYPGLASGLPCCPK